MRNRMGATWAATCGRVRENGRALRVGGTYDEEQGGSTLPQQDDGDIVEVSLRAGSS